MKNNDTIKKANNDLRDLCSNDELWHETLNIQMARMDEMQRMHDAIEEGERKGREQGWGQGWEQGIKEGIEKGVDKGKHEANLKTAQSLKRLGVDIATIVKATGLSMKEINNL